MIWLARHTIPGISNFTTYRVCTPPCACVRAMCMCLCVCVGLWLEKLNFEVCVIFPGTRNAGEMKAIRLLFKFRYFFFYKKNWAKFWMWIILRIFLPVFLDAYQFPAHMKLMEYLIVSFCLSFPCRRIINLERSLFRTWIVIERVRYLFWAIFLKVSGLRMSLSRVCVKLANVGRWVRSFCQQSSISW